MNKQIAYSQMEVKAVSEDARIITGIATTPTPDRMGDVVVSEGAVFKLPIPLLWQHDHDAPVGQVTKARVTADGIEVTAQLIKPTDDMPSQLVARLSEAWSSVKTGLVRGFSIGFRPIEYDPLKSGGLLFKKWEMFELSIVTIPANAEATITAIKRLDSEARAAFGTERPAEPGTVEKSPGVPGKVSLKQTKPEKIHMKTYAEQIKETEAKLLSIKSDMGEIMKKSMDAGETLDADEADRYDSLESQYGQVEAHLTRLKKLAELDARTAKPVEKTTEPEGVTVKSNTVPVQVKNTQKLEPGVAFARAAKCMALGFLEHRDAVQIAKNLYGEREDIVATTQRLVTKAAVAPATTTGTTWAAPLINGETPIGDFVEYLSPRTILGRFGNGGIPNLRRVPFRVPLVGQTSGGDGYWVGEGNAKPLTSFDFNKTQLDPLKVANIAVATMETVRDSSPSADILIRDSLVAALAARLDIDFVNPAKAAVAGVSPASITNGVAPITSSGTDADAIRADVRAVMAQFIASNNAPTSGVWIMSTLTALSLSLMVNALGTSEFPGLTMNGGNFMGLPVIVSEHLSSTSAGARVILVNASDIYVGDEGGVDLDMSTEASLQMDNAPASPPTATTVLVSLWQNNLIGFRAERTINWARRRPGSVAWLQGVNWGAGS